MNAFWVNVCECQGAQRLFDLDCRFFVGVLIFLTWTKMRGLWGPFLEMPHHGLMKQGVRLPCDDTVKLCLIARVVSMANTCFLVPTWSPTPRFFFPHCRSFWKMGPVKALSQTLFFSIEWHEHRHSGHVWEHIWSLFIHRRLRLSSLLALNHSLQSVRSQTPRGL